MKILSGKSTMLNQRMKTYKNFLLITFLLVVMQNCIVIEESSFNQEKFLASEPNNTNIYELKHENAFLPIMRLTPHSNVSGIFTKLLLVEFNKHPDYYMIELQEVKDGDVLGMIVLLYAHNNEMVDIYYTNDLTLRKDEYESLLNKVTLQKTDFKANLELKPSGINAYLLMTDKNGKQIELNIEENRKKVHTNGLLAPIGSGSTSPEKFPFIYLKGFSLIKQKDTNISLMIDGKDCEISKIPAFVNYEKVYNAKYSFDNFLLDLNKNADTLLVAQMVNQGQTNIDYESWNYVLNRNSDFIEISSISTSIDNKEFSILFSPSIPNLLNLKDSVAINGKFAVQLDSIKSILGGIYTIETTNTGDITIEMSFEKGWQPMPGKLWMKNYYWVCNLHKDGENFREKSYWLKTN
jgi:hypothetical protein